ncbi:MAG: hypothetical protein U0234_12700 [Sandaracinus sp.]
MRAFTLELDGSPLVDTLSLVARDLREREEVRVDDSWLSRHGCRVKPYDRFREALTREIEATRGGRRALEERRTIELVIAACRRPMLRAALDLADLERSVRFTHWVDA